MELDFTGLERKDWQYLTVYNRQNDKPVATITRRRVYDYKAPAYVAHATDGRLIGMAPNSLGIKRRIQAFFAPVPQLANPSPSFQED